MKNVVIIGAGVAGLQAAIGCASEMDEVLLVEKEKDVGGQAGTSALIENVSGYSDSGKVITQRMNKMACEMGCKIVTGEKVVGLYEKEGIKEVILSNDACYFSKAVVLALGLNANPMHIPGGEPYINRDIIAGSSPSRVRACKEKPVVIIGGANSSGQLAYYASGYASKVTILIRGNSIEDGMSRYLIEKIRNTPNIEVLTKVAPAKCEGDGKRLQSICYCDGISLHTLEACAIFCCVGNKPNTDWLPPEIEINDDGFIVCNNLQTGVEGVFSIGDINSHTLKRVGVAIGEGTQVVSFIHQYISSKEW